MEYELNKRYPKTELLAIGEWWQTHKYCDIHVNEDYIEITERADHGAPSIISDCKNYLLETDYVITKIQETSLIHPEEIENLKSHYAEIIRKRQEARQKIRELEQYL